ncbi:hypothetical protein [Rhodanobacter lindaniclasticus]
MFAEPGLIVPTMLMAPLLASPITIVLAVMPSSSGVAQVEVGGQSPAQRNRPPGGGLTDRRDAAGACVDRAENVSVVGDQADVGTRRRTVGGVHRGAGGDVDSGTTSGGHQGHVATGGGDARSRHAKVTGGSDAHAAAAGGAADRRTIGFGDASTAPVPFAPNTMLLTSVRMASDAPIAPLVPPAVRVSALPLIPPAVREMLPATALRLTSPVVLMLPLMARSPVVLVMATLPLTAVPLTAAPSASVRSTAPVPLASS